MFDFSAETGLTGLFIASFLAATLLPGGSELVLLAVIERHPSSLWPALGVATLGNTLGGLSSYLIGRLVPNPYQARESLRRAIAWLHRFGPWALLFSWLPVIGDALCVAAGWLRLPPWLSGAAIAIGKFARYAAISFGWIWITG
jgi:membrane protein YqaA with SNARE-associated domain